MTFGNEHHREKPTLNRPSDDYGSENAHSHGMDKASARPHSSQGGSSGHRSLSEQLLEAAKRQ